MINHLKVIKLINCKESLLDYCMWTMELIGSGSGRSVFILSDELVLKVCRNGNELYDVNAVEVVDELDSPIIKLTVNDKSFMAEKVY